VPVPIWPHSIAPLIPMVSHALPQMQWALAGAKRLECGSLLPLCFYAQTTCLSPYRHDAENNVPVPISASKEFLTARARGHSCPPRALKFRGPDFLDRNGSSDRLSG